MPDNTQNNWKAQLEDPECFPGAALGNKKESWEKLYSRLLKKGQPRFMAWNWAAASFLFVGITTFAIFLNKEKHPDGAVSISPPVPRQVPVRAESERAPEKKNNNAYVLLQPKQKSGPRNRKHSPVPATGPLNDKRSIDPPRWQVPQLVITSNPVLDTAIKTTTAVAPVKKRLRVVHLNEIGQPAEEPTVNNRFAERHGFELRIINGEIYNPVNSSSSNNGLILTKPRNTSN